MLITGTDYKKTVGEGTIIIDEPMDDHEGTYQCFASNAHGTAVSQKTILRKASKQKIFLFSNFCIILIF